MEKYPHIYTAKTCNNFMIIVFLNAITYDTFFNNQPQHLLNFSKVILILQCLKIYIQFPRLGCTV